MEALERYADDLGKYNSVLLQLKVSCMSSMFKWLMMLVPELMRSIVKRERKTTDE